MSVSSPLVISTVNVRDSCQDIRVDTSSYFFFFFKSQYFIMQPYLTIFVVANKTLHHRTLISVLVGSSDTRLCVAAEQKRETG